MKPNTFLALKFLSGKNRSWLFSSLTLLAVLGVVISVLAFVVVEAVMSGFSQDLRAKILGFSSHLTLSVNPESSDTDELMQKLGDHPEVKLIYPFLEGEAVLRTEAGQNQGIRIRGVQAVRLPPLEEMKVFFEEGEGWDSLAASGNQLPGILLGAELANSLGVIPALMEEVELLYPLGEVGPTGEIEPNRRVFRVLGVFRSGYYDYDTKFALMDLQEGQYLFGDSQSQKLGIYLKNPERALKLKSLAEANPQVVKVLAWQEQHARLFSALQLEQVGMALVLALMMVLASFNILSMLMMVVFERRKEIAVLRSLGLSQGKIGGIFYRAGLWIGLAGSVLGLALGGGICFAIAYGKFKLPTPYYLEALPIHIQWPVWLLVLIVVPLICLLATLFPAREGRRIEIVEALRYE